MKFKINYKRILVTVLWIMAISGLTASLAFVNKKEAIVKSGKVDININAVGESEFIA